jgi:Skp family chaperone for outer membrane proteins
MLAAGVLALGSVVYLGSRLWAQGTGVPAARPTTPAAPPAPAAAAAPAPRTKIALLNLAYVVKNYARATAFQNELKTAVDPFQKKDAALKAQYEGIEKQLKDPAINPGQRDQLEKQKLAVQHQSEDNQIEFKKVIGEKQDQQLVILYKEIQDAAARYASAHDFEMVLHYNDATTNEDYYNPMNVARKMQAGACMPLWNVPGMNISQGVVDALNAAYKAASAPATPTTPAAPTAPRGN